MKRDSAVARRGLKDFCQHLGCDSSRPQPQGLESMRQVNRGGLLLGSAPSERAWTPNKVSENRLGRTQLTYFG